MEMPAINIRQPWAKLILEKTKTIETRTYPIPKKYLDKDLLVIETSGELKTPATIVGIVRFSKSFKYESESEFKKDFSKHRVGKDSEFYWSSAKQKWGWIVSYSSPLKNPLKAPKRKGICWTQSVKFNQAALLDL
jgi:ASCH domain-containing protein